MAAVLRLSSAIQASVLEAPKNQDYRTLINSTRIDGPASVLDIVDIAYRSRYTQTNINRDFFQKSVHQTIPASLGSCRSDGLIVRVAPPSSSHEQLSQEQEKKKKKIHEWAAS